VTSTEGTPAVPLRKNWIDFALGLLGVALGWSSLTFPFGRDQGLYYYVAREWVTHGSIPYRDVLDHKTPGIYVVHAIAILLFGQKMWAIRVLDLVCMVLVGLLAATFTVEKGERPRIGARGGSVVIISVLFYGFLNFWDTEQSELWYAMLGLASIWAARRIPVLSRSQLASGALGALAMIMKPPAIWFVMIAFGLLVRDAWTEKNDKEDRTRRVIVTTARFGAGFAIPLGLMFGYFGAHHALSAMKDIVVGANGYYVTHESTINDLGDVASATRDYYRAYNPLNSLMLIGLVATTWLCHRRQDWPARNRHLLAVIMCVAGYLSVAMQRKFYLLHWTVVLGPATVVGANLLVDVMKLSEEKPRAKQWRWSALVLTIACYLGSIGGPQTWWLSNRNAFRYLTGSIDRATFAATFSVPPLGFYYGNSEAAGLWIREHSNPDDIVAVRGFDPEIYAIADRHYSGRFFWTTFLVSPVRAYRRAEWLAEDRNAFAKNPPRYVVTLTNIHDGLDSAEFYYPLGYEQRAAFNEFTILERVTR
jgi:hypothetical protein